MLGWGLCEDRNEAGDLELINFDESSFPLEEISQPLGETAFLTSQKVIFLSPLVWAEGLLTLYCLG